MRAGKGGYVMKYIQLIYNPMAGSRTFKTRLDTLIEIIEKNGYELRIWRTRSEEDFAKFFKEGNFDECEAILIAGGDGTVNQAVNAMMENKIKRPVGVIPAGTANDFAQHLGIPENFNEAFEVIAQMKIRKLDIGIVNGQYFVNVCGGGLLTSIAHTIEPEFKNTLGKLAYYIKGVQQIPKFKSQKVRITTDQQVYEDEFYLFIVLNGSSAGGFNRVGEYASMRDGKLDFVGFKACSVNEIPGVFAKMMRGEHLEDKNILYFQSRKIHIECLEEDGFPADVDGELGPKYPLDIKVIPEGIEFIVKTGS
jgi:YegS/Rv2252/BmrU family lipid kinase